MMFNQNAKADIETKKASNNQAQIRTDLQNFQNIQTLKPEPVVPEQKQITYQKPKKNENNTRK